MTMSGHSKWHSIKHKKGAADAKKGKVFTKHAADIALAARDGDDPDMNAKLRLAIEKAKKDSTPKTNIEKAIARGSGKSDGKQIEELTYEGYGPNGVALLINTVTDNRNRTSSDVKSTLSKLGGNLGTPGSVAYMFDSKGIIDLIEGDKDDLSMLAIEAGAEDVDDSGDNVVALTSSADLQTVVDALGDKVSSSESKKIPNQYVEVDKEAADKIEKLVDTLEEYDDIIEVFTNIKIV